MKLGLDAMNHLLEELGSPHKSFTKIQIAGTNGKGSTCSFLESICIESGIKTGVTTSPHLVSVLERIRINGVEISEEEFGRCIGEVREAATRLLDKKLIEHLPTFFEHVVAAALLGFRDAGIEVAIIETGLGGRLDATTAACAELFGITRIDLDHQEYLGDTIEMIAAEKSAIISEGSNVVSGIQVPEAERVIRQFADSRNATLDFVGPSSLPAGFVLGLLGEHQLENAAVAVGISLRLCETGIGSIDEESIKRGLSGALHPGRLEFTGEFLLDGAHNISGAKVLRSFLDQRCFRKRVFIFGAMKGKDIKEMFQKLLDENSIVLAVPVDSPRALSPIELMAAARSVVGGQNAQAFDSIDDALLEMRKIRSSYEWNCESDIVCVTGSLYLIGEFKAKMNSIL
jgi:dihydrofolate synthase/folylpolyglutamate synthase